MEEWVLPRAPEDERVQASALGLSSSTAYPLTTAFSCHCLAGSGGRASEHPDRHRAVGKSETTPSPTQKGLRHGPTSRDVC